MTNREIIGMSTHNEMMELIYYLFSNTRLCVTNEIALHGSIAGMFNLNGIAYEREVKIGPSERIDFKIDSIGIEVKIKGSSTEVIRQLQRYAKSGEIDVLILITTKALHDHNIPNQIQGMPVKIISLWKNRL